MRADMHRGRSGIAAEAEIERSRSMHATASQIMVNLGG